MRVKYYIHALLDLSQVFQTSLVVMLLLCNNEWPCVIIFKYIDIVSKLYTHY